MNPTERDWMIAAACRGHDPELWFPSTPSPGNSSAAQRICALCRVSSRCADYADALQVSHGVWGGAVQKRSAGQSTRRHLLHGTEAMYRRHLRRGETPCPDCKRAASREHQRRLADRASRAVQTSQDAARA